MHTWRNGAPLKGNTMRTMLEELVAGLGFAAIMASLAFFALFVK